MILSEKELGREGEKKRVMEGKKAREKWKKIQVKGYLKKGKE